METKQKEKIKKVAVGLNGHSHHAETEIRLAVQKTYKLYIDGKFPRTESGRYYKLNDKNGKVIANICRASRKDFRDAVVVARKAQGDWQKKSAFNRSQILYRIAETLETRRLQFVSTLGLQGVSETAAQKEVSAAE